MQEAYFEVAERQQLKLKKDNVEHRRRKEVQKVDESIIVQNLEGAAKIEANFVNGVMN
jgi:hypothetical protein